MFRISTFLMMFFVIASCFGQVPDNGGEINQKDENGRKTGVWVVYAKEKNLPIYRPDDIYETGEYINGRKEGVWKRFYPSGNLLSEITMVNGRPSGEFTTYHDKEGAVSEKGAMNGRMMKGPHIMINEDGVVTIEKNYGEDGKMEGKQIHRYDNGQIEVEFEKKDGKNTGKTVYYYKNGDVRKTIEYGENGEVLKTEEKERVRPAYKPKKPKKPGKRAPKVPSGTHLQIDGKKIDAVEIPPGRQKIFLPGGDILYDGFFEDGVFREGEYFVYDSDGLLDHIEVYKDFEYVANGVIKD